MNRQWGEDSNPHALLFVGNTNSRQKKITERDAQFRRRRRKAEEIVAEKALARAIAEIWEDE